MPQMQPTSTGWSKTCTVCGKTYEAQGTWHKAREILAEHFSKNYQRDGDNLRPECKDCKRLNTQATKHNISTNEIKALKKGICDICNTELTHDVEDKATHMNIDHCHSTNRIRGILCNHCNRGLGHFRDSITILEAAINYLKKHETVKREE